MRPKDISPEEAIKQVKKILKERGTKALEIAKKEILQEKIESKEAKEAISYFMTQYWHDLARPSLLSLACEAVGGDPEQTTSIAVSMSLLSGAMDIHDDIIDESRHKDGRPTVFGKFGKGIALLIGDALLLKGLILLQQAKSNHVLSRKMDTIAEIINDMFFELGDAEAMELRFRGRLDTSPEEYIRIVRKKAADVEAHTKISAIVGNGSQREIKALSKYGRLLGMLIILRDDWLDMIDSEEFQQRIKKECLPLPLLYALQNQNFKPILKVIIQKEIVGKEDIQKILQIVKESAAMKKFSKLTQEITQEACTTLESLKYNKTELVLLVRAMVPLV